MITYHPFPISGCRYIFKGPHEGTGERMFTIQGTSDANEKALYLLYKLVESDKELRIRWSCCFDRVKSGDRA